MINLLLHACAKAVNNYIICYCMPVQKLLNRNNYIICYCMPVQKLLIMKGTKVLTLGAGR